MKEALEWTVSIATIVGLIVHCILDKMRFYELERRQKRSDVDSDH